MAFKTFKAWVEDYQERREQIERLVEVAKEVNPDLEKNQFLGLPWIYDIAFQMTQRTETERLRKEFNMTPEDAIRDLCAKMTAHVDRKTVN